MGKPEWGNKHLCASCGTRYYDMGAANPVCPHCGTESANKPPPKPRRGRKAKEASAEPPPKSAVPPLPKKKAARTDDALEDDDIEAIETDDDEDDDEIIEDAAELGDESEDMTKVIDTVIEVDES